MLNSQLKADVQGRLTDSACGWLTFDGASEIFRKRVPEFLTAA
jgi:hypothetical protein